MRLISNSCLITTVITVHEPTKSIRYPIGIVTSLIAESFSLKSYKGHRQPLRWRGGLTIYTTVQVHDWLVNQ
jgi:hypothetical protein